MRHGRRVKKLGVKTAHRKAMLSNMAYSLISTGKIKTTTARAKVLQGQVEKLITLAKRGDLHSRRQAVEVLRDRQIVKRLFDEIAPEFENANGGYTRRAFYGRRLGDGASLSVVELNIEKKVAAEAKKEREKSKSKTKDKTEEKKSEAGGKKKAAAKRKKSKSPKK